MCRNSHGGRARSHSRRLPCVATLRLRMKLPVIDVSPLLANSLGVMEVAKEIGAACPEHGFFCIVGHGIDGALQDRLAHEASAFFARTHDEKMQIAMQRAGPAWRGYFPVGAELTSGKPDRKEGIYFGQELPPDDERVARGKPMHGANLFPSWQPEMRASVLSYMDAMTNLAHAVMRGVALSLGLDAHFFASTCARDPLVLFRL